MLGCVSFFLSEGLVKYKHVNLKLKQLIDSSSVEFAEFIKCVKLNDEYEKKELCIRVDNDFSEMDRVGIVFVLGKD